MTELSLADAAALTGKDPSTITRAVAKGKVSCRINADGHRVFDPAELERAFGTLRNPDDAARAHRSANASERMGRHEDAHDHHARTQDLMQQQIALLHAHVQTLSADRDHWRQQATYLLEDRTAKDSTLHEQRTQQHLTQEQLIRQQVLNEHLKRQLQDAQIRLEHVRRSWMVRIFAKV